MVKNVIMLTVVQLIEKLEKMPQDAVVCIYGRVPSKPFSVDLTVVDTTIEGVKTYCGDEDDNTVFLTI